MNYYQGTSLFKQTLSPSCPPPTRPSLDPDDPLSYEWGFKRFLNLFLSPAVGASMLAVAFFFFIVFASNVILLGQKITTLGITLTFTILFFLSLAILVLFII